MQKLFYLYLSVSLSASVIIAVLFLCRPLWKRRFSKSWQYYIWLLAVVRLLIPLSPSPGMIGRAADWGTERLAAGLSAVMASEDQYSPVPVSPVRVSTVPVFPMDDGYTQPKDEMSDPEEPFTAGDSGPQRPSAVFQQERRRRACRYKKVQRGRMPGSTILRIPKAKNGGTALKSQVSS